MRVCFSDVFQLNSDGTISPKKVVSVGRVIMFPGVKYAPEDSDLDLHLLEHRNDDLEIDSEPWRNLVTVKTFVD